MSSLIAALLLSTSILLFALRLLTRSGSSRQGVTFDDYSNARKEIELLFLEIAAAQRIFAVEDLEFVACSGSAKVKRLFLRERKKLALQWLRTIQNQVAQLLDLHLRFASYTYNPSAGFEVRLTIQYWGFSMLCRLIQLHIWLVGPFQAWRAMVYTSHVVGSFCTTFNERLNGINTSRLSCSAEPLLH